MRWFQKIPPREKCFHNFEVHMKTKPTPIPRHQLQNSQNSQYPITVELMLPLQILLHRPYEAVLKLAEPEFSFTEPREITEEFLC